MLALSSPRPLPFPLSDHWGPFLIESVTFRVSLWLKLRELLHRYIQGVTLTMKANTMSENVKELN